MAEFPYLLTPKSIRPFLNHIQGAGVPPKVTVKYLEATGFKSKSDRSIIGVLKFIGFIDSTGTPTDTWKKFRSKATGSAVLAAAMRTAYKSLFETYPDACDRPNSVIRDFVSSHSNSGERALDAIVGTFKALCAAASFSKESGEGGQDDEPKDGSDEDNGEQEDAQKKSKMNGKGGSVQIIMNIQLVVPATDDPAIYDSFFDAMKRHLIQNDE